MGAREKKRTAPHLPLATQILQIEAQMEVRVPHQIKSQFLFPTGQF